MAAEPTTAILPLRSGEEPLAVAPFPTWTYDDAADAVRALLPDDFGVRRDYARDEHWSPNGVKAGGYIGPWPSDEKAQGRIEAQFAPYDACGEGLNAVEDAFSMEAQIGFAPIEEVEEGDEIPEEIRTLGEQAVAILYALWDRVKLHEELKPAIRTAAWAERAFLRWWIPPGRAIRSLDAEGNAGPPRIPGAQTPEEAATWLSLSRPLPDAAAIVTDEATQEKAAVYLDEDKIDGQDVQRAQIAYLDGDKLVLRTVWQNDERDPAVMELKTGGRLPMAEMRGDNLLTPSVIRTQKQLDYLESILSRVVETAGFRERYITNAEPAGKRRTLKPGEDPAPGSYLWTNGPDRIEITPEIRTLGAAITTEIVGLVTSTQDGKQVRATPTIESFDPVDPDFAIKAGRHARAKILRMMRQGHRVGDSTGEASGFAYQQDRAAFEKDLQNRRGSAEGMLVDLLTGALALIEHLCGKPGLFTSKLRLTVAMHVDAGPRSPEERSQDREDVSAGLLSPDTAMARGGIEDVEGEVKRIASNPLSRLRYVEKVAETFESLTRSTSEEAAIRALIAAGVEPELANALRSSDTDNEGAGL